MPSTFAGLQIGKSGLYAYQVNINTTAHNISNTETAGYSRQIAKQQASQAISVGSSYGMVGTGVTVTSIEQIRSKYLDEKFSFNTTLSGEYSTKAYYMQEIQSYLNEITVDGFTTNFNNFFNTLQDLSTDPSSGTTRTQVSSYGENLTKYLNMLNTNLQSIQTECNTDVKNHIDRINSIAAQLTTITQQINAVEVTGITANDLRDQRQLIIDELSEYVSVDVTENVVSKDVGTTTYVVRINGQTLVDTNTYNTLEPVPRKELVNQNDVEGLYDIQWTGGIAFNATGDDVSGSLKSVLLVRDGNNNENLRGSVSGTAGSKTLTMTGTQINSIDKLNITEGGYVTVGNKKYQYTGFRVTEAADGSYVYEFKLAGELEKNVSGSGEIGDSIDYKGIPYYMSQLNEFVRVFAQKYNDICKSGEDLNGDQGLDFFVGVDKVTGSQMTFNNNTAGVVYDSTTSTTGSYYQLTVGNIAINSIVSADPNKIVSCKDVTQGVENTDILKQLIGLKTDTSMFKQGSPASFFQTMVAEIGVNTQTAINLAKNQEDICKSIENQRYSVSGVDLDEEALNLVKFQNAYNLNSKVVSIMNEMLDRLINYMGV